MTSTTPSKTGARGGPTGGTSRPTPANLSSRRLCRTPSIWATTHSVSANYCALQAGRGRTPGVDPLVAHRQLGPQAGVGGDHFRFIGLRRGGLHLRSRSTTCATTTSLTASARTRTMDPPGWLAHPRSLREHPRRRTRPAVMSLRHWARTHLAFSRTVRAPPPRPETPGQSGCSTKNAESGGRSKPPVPRCDHCKSDVRLNTWREIGAHRRNRPGPCLLEWHRGVNPAGPMGAWPSAPTLPLAPEVT